jgi:hypothetical protein
LQAWKRSTVKTYLGKVQMLSVGEIKNTAGSSDNDMRLVVGDGLKVLLDVDTFKNDIFVRRVKTNNRYYNNKTYLRRKHGS